MTITTILYVYTFFIYHVLALPFIKEEDFFFLFDIRSFCIFRCSSYKDLNMDILPFPTLSPFETGRFGMLSVLSNP